MSQDYDISADIIQNRDVKDVDVVTAHDTTENQSQESKPDEADGNENAVDHPEVTESSGNSDEPSNICKQGDDAGKDDSKDNEDNKTDESSTTSHSNGVAKGIKWLNSFEKGRELEHLINVYFSGYFFVFLIILK